MQPATANAELPIEQPRSRLRADTLVNSVVILLFVSVVQRTVGFGRGILFCRWLQPDELGRWEMAYSFIMFAAPLAVLGIPGSFGRYVEHYRQRNQLRSFLVRTTTSTATLLLCTIALIVLAAPLFAELIFGQPTQKTLVMLVALCLGATILHHYIESLLTGMRMFRVVSAMHCAQSVGFATIALSLLAWWRLHAASIVVGYGLACLLSAVGALIWLRHAAAELPPDDIAPTKREFWPRIMRFAFWVWVTNLFAGSFAAVDRYMILHFGKFNATEALVQVGYYHSSRIVPLLLVSVADLLGSIVLPHLTSDWEAGRREAVSARMRLIIKTTAMTMFAASVCVLLIAPLIFDVAFGGRYDGGLVVLPLTLAYCALNGVMLVTLTYLWCAEKTGLSCIPAAIALAVNVALNLLLLPQYGLMGAVAATVVANAICLAVACWLCQRAGLEFDTGTLLLAAMPLTLAAGLKVSLCALFALMLLLPRSLVLFSDWERQQFESIVSRIRSKLTGSEETL